MKYFIILTIAAFASGARLDSNVYLPPHAGSSSGDHAGLQTPFQGPKDTFRAPQDSFRAPQDSFRSPQGGFEDHGAYQAQSASANAEILRYDNEINEKGYHYAYETSDGTKAEQEGRVIPGAAPEEGSLQVSGSYSYIGDDGQTYTVTYTADENGYHAEGAHLPTPPPIPEAILKSLELTSGTGGHYNSKKSSYDADAGY